MLDKNPNNPEQTDYIEPGGDRHANLLGLRRAKKGDEPQYEGWTFLDGAPLGVFWQPEHLMQLLKQKVSSLTTLPPVMQSEDPHAPNFAPPAWSPREPDDVVRGII